MPRRSRGYRFVTVAAAFAVVPALAIALGAVTAAARGDQARAARDRGMYVTVVDGDGKPVTDLSNREFVVREDGVRREVLLVERTTDPLTIALVLDNTQAASAFVPDMRRALKSFVERMAGGNPIAVTTFADRPTILQDYTLVAPDLQRAVERVFPQPNSGSYVLQALQQVSAGFAKRDFQRGVIVVVTAEGPEFSDLHYAQVVEALRASGASLNALVVAPTAAAPIPTTGPDADNYRNREEVLELGTRETGGRRVILLSSMALDEALKKLGDQLTHEYRLTYARPDTLIPPRTIEVSVTRPGLDARGVPIKPTRG